MKPKSNNLFHFTKSLDILKLILEKGVQPRYCLEDIEWLNMAKHKYIAYPMSCFCDIPLSRIYEHTDFYGGYGIGLTKEWGNKNNLNPVIYSPPGGHISLMAEFMLENEKSGKEEDMHVYHLLSLIKPTIGKMVVSGKIVEKEFYQENEWRYVPSINSLLFEKDYEENKDKANSKINEHTLKFTPDDVKYIFVQSDTDIPSLVDFINEKLGHFPLSDLKIMQTRIVSLDTLSTDI